MSQSTHPAEWHSDRGVSDLIAHSLDPSQIKRKRPLCWDIHLETLRRKYTFGYEFMSSEKLRERMPLLETYEGDLFVGRTA